MLIEMYNLKKRKKKEVGTTDYNKCTCLLLAFLKIFHGFED
jgi:hypothetical protein